MTIKERLKVCLLFFPVLIIGAMGAILYGLEGVLEELQRRKEAAN